MAKVQSMATVDMAEAENNRVVSKVQRIKSCQLNMRSMGHEVRKGRNLFKLQSIRNQVLVWRFRMDRRDMLPQVALARNLPGPHGAGMAKVLSRTPYRKENPDGAFHPFRNEPAHQLVPLARPGTPKLRRSLP